MRPRSVDPVQAACSRPGHTRLVGLLLAAGFLPLPLAAQSSDAGSADLPPLLPREREVALARSAAPPEISVDATILVLARGTGYEVASEGTNGVTCLVSRSWPEAIEPHCFDPEGSRTILRVHLREAELKEHGWTREAIQADVAEGLRTGRLTPPSRPAVTWMMSAGQILYDDDGRRVGAWKPHLMIYHPYLTEADVGLTGPPPSDGPMVVDAGRPTANLVIVMPAFVEPDPPGAG
jgi:hypothetical protein